jgi:hypothetical protein
MVLQQILALSAAVAIGSASAGSLAIAGETRTWTDSTGAFSIEAELVSSANNKVELRKADGRVITVPLERPWKSSGHRGPP